MPCFQFSIQGLFIYENHDVFKNYEELSIHFKNLQVNDKFNCGLIQKITFIKAPLQIPFKHYKLN